MTTRLTLVSHTLCPYVQRVAIVLAEKGLPFERRDIDLGNKPDWFLKVSPLGKTPVLLVDEVPVFESSAICEFLEDRFGRSLHPDYPMERAQHRAWMEVGSGLLGQIGAFYSARDDSTLKQAAEAIRARLSQVDAKLGDGPYFAGSAFSMVDAVFAPALRYLPVLDPDDACVQYTSLSRVTQWADALAERPSVIDAVTPDYPDQLRRFVVAKESALARRLTVAPSKRPREAAETVSPRSPWPFIGSDRGSWCDRFLPRRPT